MTVIATDRLSVMTMPMARDVLLRRFSFDDLCAMLRRHGIDHIDILDLELKLYGRKRVLAALARHDISIASLIASVPFLTAAPDPIAKRVRAVIDTAVLMGTTRIMVVPGDLVTAAKRVHRMPAAEKAERYRQGLALAVEMARARHVEILFEDTPNLDSGLSTTDECAAVLEAVPGLGLVFDTANMVVGGDDPVEFYERVSERVSYVQFKDVTLAATSKGDLTHDGRRINTCVWGEGIVPLVRLAALLEADDHHGVISVEYCTPQEKGTLQAHERQLGKFLQHQVIGAAA